MQKLVDGARKLGLNLTNEQVNRFEVYYRELVDWNKRMNLTAVTDCDEVQIKHFLDSLTVIAGVKSTDTGQGFNVIDIGTGAGLPGIPLKIVRPDIRLALLEATSKKTKFLQHVIGRLGLDNVEVVNGRAEIIAHDLQYREIFHLALSRAVASLPTLVELALPFCIPGGRFIAQKKGNIESELKQAGKAIRTLGGRILEVKPVEIIEPEDKRCLVIIEKISPSPIGYPRRPGVPAKRPLIS
jgi:16S rRNA (guanine527-N7)-methyltransferase